MNVEHYHCPRPEHEEKPQPMRVTPHDGGPVVRICGRCLFEDETETVMVPCTPEVCDDG